MKNEETFLTKDLEKAIQAWENAVEWIVKGWDCLDEYTHDLSAREDLMEVMLCAKDNGFSFDRYLYRIDAADNLFRKHTISSRLCVFHCTPQFRCDLNGEIEFTYKHYQRITYWYFYRWLPDCPISWQGHNGFSYQKDIWGLDFENMSTKELKVAAHKLVAYMKEELDRSKKHYR